MTPLTLFLPPGRPFPSSSKTWLYKTFASGPFMLSRQSIWSFPTCTDCENQVSLLWRWQHEAWIARLTSSTSVVICGLPQSISPSISFTLLFHIWWFASSLNTRRDRIFFAKVSASVVVSSIYGQSNIKQDATNPDSYEHTQPPFNWAHYLRIHWKRSVEGMVRAHRSRWPWTLFFEWQPSLFNLVMSKTKPTPRSDLFFICI